MLHINSVFVTADQYLGHENIIKFCDRPFATVEEMDQVLIIKRFSSGNLRALAGGGAVL